MNNEIISVIVPIYNVEKYLSKCIDSIINQTYKYLEIILVNDGSTDDCKNICDDYKKKDSRIIVFHQENKGLSSAKNKGLELATGDLIGFVDGDDYIEPTMYEKLLNNMHKYNSDMSICDFNNIINNIKKSNKINSNILEFQTSGKEKYNNMYNSYSIIAFVSWNKFYKKELFYNVRYPNGKYYEDVNSICNILNEAKSISYIIEPLYNYVYRKDSIVNRFSLKHFDKILASDKIINFLREKKYYDLVKLEKNKKANNIILNLSKMNIYHINNKEIYDKYYNELVITSKELKWKDSNKYVKRFKVFKRYYILSRSIALGFIL